MSIEVKDGVVTKDGQEVGLWENHKFSPVDTVHHKTAESIRKELETQFPKPKKGEEPPKDPMQGDKTPAYVQWYRDNHTKEEFEAKYGGRTFNA